MGQDYLMNTWYFAATSAEVPAENKPGALFHRKLLDRDVVFYRSEDGAPHALLDRCPHRFAPLHMGRVVGNDLQCGYHGLRFDCSGRCVQNPHGNGFIPPRARVDAFVVEERYGLVWIWMGAPEMADLAQIPPMSYLVDPSRSKVAGHHVVQAHYELVNDNLADLTHVQFVHAGYLDSENFEKRATYSVDQGERSVTNKYLLENAPAPALWARVLKNDRLIVDRWLETTWFASSGFSLFTCVATPGSGRERALGSVRSAHLLTPETARSTHYYYAHTRDYSVGDAQTDATVREWQRTGFREQDQPFLEAVDRVMGGASLEALHPVLLATDAGAMRIRRLLARLIAEERAAVQAPQPAASTEGAQA